MSLKINKIFLFLIVILGLILGIVASYIPVPKYPVDVVLEAQFSKPSRIGMFLTKDRASVRWMNTTSTEKKKYIFKNSYPLEDLRFNLAPSVVGSKIVVYNVNVLLNNKVLYTISPELIKNLFIHDLVLKKIGKDCLLYQTTGTDPYIDHFPTLNHSFNKYNLIFSFLERLTPASNTLTVLLYYYFIVLIILGLFFKKIESFFILFLTPLIAVFINLGLHLGNVILGRAAIPSVNLTVGATAFLGYSENSEYFSVFGTIFAIIAIAVVVFFIFRKKFISTGFSSYDDAIPSSISKKFSINDFLFVFIILFILLLLKFPNLFQLAKSYTHNLNLYNFDAMNMQGWSYFYYKGWLPFKVFWYIYGGLYNKVAYGIMPHFYLYLHTILLYSVLVYCLYQLLNRYKMITILSIFFIWYNYCIGNFDADFRYLMSVTVYLFYFVNIYSLKEISFKSVSRWILFGCFSAYCFTQESAQLVYAFPALLLSLIIYIIYLYQKNTSKLDYLRLFILHLIGFGAGAFCLIIYLKHLFFNGQLGGYFGLYKSASTFLDSGAYPWDISRWAIPSSNYNSIFMYTIVMLGIFSVLNIILSILKRKDLFLSNFFLGMVLINLMFYPKLICRPWGVAEQVLPILFIGVIVFVISYSKFYSKVSAFIYIIFIFFCSFSISYNSVNNHKTTIYNNLVSIPKSFEILVWNTAKKKEAESKLYSASSESSEIAAVIKFFTKEDQDKKYDNLSALVKSEVITIMDSGLFDPKYYFKHYPDVKASGMDPLLHYVEFGWKEGRNPSKYFNTNYYLKSNPDVKKAGINPLYHYILFGRNEGRKPSIIPGVIPSNLIKSNNLKPKHTFFVLGDDSFFYILLGQKPPYFISFYNCSDIFSQHVYVRYLKEMNPQYAIWNKDRMSFDGVPNYTRCPIIFNYVIKHYKPRKRFGSYLILKKMNTGDIIDNTFWEKTLGDTIDLGSIPYRSDAYNMRNQSQRNNGISQEKLITKIYSDKKQKGLVAFYSDNHLLGKVSFDVYTGINYYTFKLNRLWFIKDIANIKIEFDGNLLSNDCMYWFTVDHSPHDLY